MTTETETTSTGGAGAHSAPTVLTAERIAEIPKAALGTLEHVENQVLWTDDASIAGVLTVPAGQRLGSHVHRVHHHHFWVLSGSAVVMDREVGPGSYVHIPSGVEHDIDATSTAGCAVYYLYLPPHG